MGMENLGQKQISQVKKTAVVIPINRLSLSGILRIPANPKAVVIFAHGSGSGRYSPRNNYVANILSEANIATLLFDLLTEDEDVSFTNRFNIELLTNRLISVTKWIQRVSALKEQPVGYFGASTGTAAALKAAARIGNIIQAVVSRGGRPDLAMDEIGSVQAPTLLIVGENDPQVISLNQQAYQALNTTKKLEIIPKASHLFEEPGTLEKAARLAVNWFGKYLHYYPRESFLNY